MHATSYLTSTGVTSGITQFTDGRVLWKYLQRLDSSTTCDWHIPRRTTSVRQKWQVQSWRTFMEWTQYLAFRQTINGIALKLTQSSKCHCLIGHQGDMYIGHGRLCVCVCLSVPCRIPTLLHRPKCNSGDGRGCPLVLHYWADLQLVHKFRCYDNIQVCKLIALYTANAYSDKHKLSASACTRSTARCL